MRIADIRKDSTARLVINQKPNKTRIFSESLNYLDIPPTKRHGLLLVWDTSLGLRWPQLPMPRNLQPKHYLYCVGSLLTHLCTAWNYSGGISQAAVYRHPHEALEVISFRTPSLQQVLSNSKDRSLYIALSPSRTLEVTRDITPHTSNAIWSTGLWIFADKGCQP